MQCTTSLTCNPPKLRCRTSTTITSLVSNYKYHKVSPSLKQRKWVLNCTLLGPNPSSSISILDYATSIILAFQEYATYALHKIIAPPLHPWVDPSQVFTGNFAPVDELAPTNCPVVEGKIPDCLNGVYIRNGSNPQHKYSDIPLHFFEGDGMLHSLRLSKGQATYCSRYVKTYKYIVERDAGFPIFPNLLTGFHRIKDVLFFVVVLWRIITGRINLMRGFGIANTSVTFLANKLLALGESDLPYIMYFTKEGDIETIGRWEFDKKLFASMTAHPKFDLDTNEAFAFRCTPFFPFITYFWFDKDGVKLQDVPLFSVKEPCFIHDFAITKRFAIFPDTNLAVKPMKMILGRGMPVVFETGKIQRIGILPRYSTSDSNMKWFPVPGFNAMHVINAWDQGEDEVVLVAPNILSIEDIFQRIDKVHFSLEKLVINIRTGQFSRSNFSESSLEFGSIHPNYVGKKNRFVYAGIGEAIPKMSGVVKIDLEKGCEVSRRLYEPNCFGGEPLFVAREENNVDSDEDNGFVVTYVHNEDSGESSFLVMDAKSSKLAVLASIKLPRRVPYGFHGLFVAEKDL